MICKVENCGIQLEDLTMHIKEKHNITAVDYKKIYNEEFLIDECLRKKRAETRFKNYEFQCSVDGEKFATEKSLKCHYELKKDLKHNYLLYNDSNVDDWVECNICNFRLPQITRHVHEHGFNSTTYKGELYSKNTKILQAKLRAESRERNFKFPCPAEKCGLKFLTQASLYYHLEINDDLEHNYVLFNDSNKDDWTECKICGVRKTIIEKHLKIKHNMSTEDYKEKYNCEVFSKNYYEYNIMNFVMAGSRVDKSKAAGIRCEKCEKTFSSTESLNVHIKRTLDKEHSSIYNNEKNIDEWVECKICGIRMSRIDLHLKAIHKISKEEYVEKFKSQCFSKSFIEKSKLYSKMCHGNENSNNEISSYFKDENVQQKMQKISKYVIDGKITDALIIQTEKFKNQEETIDEILTKIKGEL